MKFTCEKKMLIDAVSNVSKAISEKAPFPALSGMKLRLDRENLELTGYNMEIGIRTTISVESSDSGQCIIDAALFSNMLRKLDESIVLIEISSNYQVTISSGVTTFNLVAQNSDEYPELPTVNSEDSIKVSQPILKNMIEQSVFAVAVTDMKPILKGELFEIQGGKLTLAAIDGYRLAVRSEPIKFEGEKKFVVPAITLSKVTDLLSDNEEDTAELCPTLKHIIFKINGYMVYSRLLEGEFHPYRSAIPAESKTEVTVDRKQLIAALERTMLIINDRAPSPVRCYFENNTLKINCKTTVGNKISDEISAVITGPVIEIGFKCKYLLDPLKVIDDERVKLQMNGSLLPMKIVSCDDNESEKYTYLVLPVRLPKD
ncbi:MAG: DNA polymerase III subunit beta [Ruminococcus sp.]|nr:DNA polymerase III subunit beta [Ruminococcus sp.]